MSVYEVYVLLWCKGFDWCQFVDEFVLYVRDFGFMYVEFLLVMYYLYLGLWGY